MQRGSGCARYRCGGGVSSRPQLPGGLSEQASTALLRPNHYEILLDGERLRVYSPLAGEHQRRNLALAIARGG